MFKLTVIFKHEMIGLLPNIYSNFELSETFELTMFKLTVPDLYHIWMTLHPIYQFQAKTCNTVSEFTHSNWITLSYYSIPEHKEFAS